MHEIVFSPETVKDIKSKGYPPGSVASNKVCFDSSKNIAYEGILNAKGEPEDANVIRIHNPKIIPISEIPPDGPGNKILLKKFETKRNMSRAIKAEDIFSGGPSYYAGIYLEGNDFEGDLKKAGISTDYLKYFDGYQ